MITVVRYATVSELCRAFRKYPDSQKIIRNRMKNQVRSTPIRIPNRLNSLIDPGLRSMMQW